MRCYAVIYRRKNVVYWQCTKRGKNDRCYATVSQRDCTFIQGSHQHNHPPTAGLQDGLHVRKAVRDHAKEDIFKPAAAIVEEIVLGETESSKGNKPLPSISNLV